MVLAINVANLEASYIEYLEEAGYEHVWFARDARGDIARQYGVRSLPATYLIDREGIIQYAAAGFGRGVERRLEDGIAGLLD